MILDLDNEASLDPGRVGSKAAWLARARTVGLPVLPGFVVEYGASLHHIWVGAEALAGRGSGGARLAVGGEPLGLDDDLIAAGTRLGSPLVARSSTTLEGRAEWSGAFTSYLELTPPDLPKAVVGCWASAFSVDALGRQAAAGIEPGSFGMAVLVQPELRPEAGGTATITDDGSVVVRGVAGSPAPLLTGWSAGLEARLEPVANGRRWRDGGLVELIGMENLDELSRLMSEANEILGATQGEWALDGGMWILQLGIVDKRRQDDEPVDVGEDVDPVWLEVVRGLARAPGPLGEELVLPWALAGLPGDAAEAIGPGRPTLEDCGRLSRELTAHVWGEEAAVAVKMAGECLQQLHGPDPTQALARIKSLEPADPARAIRLLADVDALESHRSANRVGRGKWEPLIAAVVLVAGERHQGTPASPGIGAGISAQVSPGEDAPRFAARNVVVIGHPLPFAAPLLWDAAGLVTRSGSPAAHLFRSAGALGVPAVCGVAIGDERDQLVAVEGGMGVVATIPLHGPDA